MNLRSHISQELPPEPDPYDPDRFADRREELTRFDRKVDEGLSGHPITQPVAHIWGIRGVGKSWLLRHLQTRYGASQEKQKDTLCALADFSTLRFTLWEPLSVAGLLEQLVEAIEEQVDGRAAAELGVFYSELDAVREDQDRDPAELAHRFVALVNLLSEEFVPLLLFDAVEKLDEDDFFWLESRLIEPLARTDRAIVVVAGRKEIPRWRELGVRRRLDVLELQPFQREGTLEQLEKRGCGHLVDVIYSLSFGHPYANQVMGTALAQLAKVEEIDRDFERTYRAEVLKLLEQVEGELLRGIWSETHQDILRMLSTLRKFNIESARAMLSLLDEQYQEKSDGYYLRLFEDLEDTHLVWWSPEQRGYVLGAPLRRMMDLRIRKADLTLFIERHRRAMELYKEWIERNPVDRGPFLLEALYHLSNTLVGKSSDEVQEQVEKFLRQFLKSENFSTDRADSFYQLLQRDPELRDHRRVMPQAVYEYIIEKVRRFRDQIAGVRPVEERYRLEPIPYRPDQFVNREDALEAVRDRVGQICRGETTGRPIVHFHGLPRIGKTWLLSHIAHSYAEGERSDPAGRAVLVVWVDCGTAARSDDARTALLQACREQSDGNDKKRLLAEARDMGHVLEILSTLTDKVVPLLLFDEADALKEENFEWLEEELLAPLASSGRAVIVVTGQRRAPRWSRFETRRGIDYICLRPFDVSETVDQLRKVHADAMAREIHRLSGGHPYASWLLAQAPGPLGKRETATLLEPVERDLMRDVPARCHEALRMMAVLRHFNIGSLRGFLTWSVDQVYGEKSDAFYLGFLDKARSDPDWLSWDLQSRNYAFSPVVRCILLQRLRLVHPDKYRHGHRTALKLYKERMDTYPENCVGFLIEAIYHQAALGEFAGQPEDRLWVSLRDLLNEYLRAQNFSVDQALELQRVLEEDQGLREYVPPRIFEMLWQQIHNFVDRVRRRYDFSSH